MAARKGPNLGQNSKTPKVKRSPIVADDRGRPIFDPTFHPLAARRQMLLGSTDLELAEDFGISPRLLYKWRADHPELDLAIRRSKRLADGEVAASLFDRARERVVDRVKPMVVSDGKGEGSRVELVAYREIESADVRAARFWLASRDPQRWALNGPRGDATDFGYDVARADAALDALIADARGDRAARGEPPIAPQTPAEEVASRIAIGKLIGGPIADF